MARGKKKAAVDAALVEGPWDLPDGWRWEPLGELVVKSSGKHQPDKHSKLPFVGLEHIAPHEMHLDGIGAFSAMRSAGSAFERGDVLYGRLRPYLNKVWIADRAGACSGELLVLRPKRGMDARYIALNLHSQRYVYYASHIVTGDRPRIDFDLVAAFPIPVPDEITQRAVVARIDALFAEIDAGETALTDARSGVETYRKSLLKAAVTGELTADWRRDNPPRESGADLLRRILAERRTRWHADPKNAKKKYVEPVGPDVDGLPALPSGWVWANLDQLATHEVRNGLSVKDTSEPTEVRALKLGALGGEIVDWSIFRFLPLTAQSVSGYQLQEGDLLVSRANGSPNLVGRASLCIEPPTDMIFPDTAIRFRLAGQKAVRDWVVRVWNSLLIRSQISKLAKTTAGILKISQGDISRIALPIPGNAEMSEINRIIVARFAEVGFGDQIEPLRDLSTSLRQSILAAAFRGDLTP